MKQAICAGVFLLLTLGGTLWHSACLREAMDSYAGQLTAARRLADEGDWAGAEEMTRRMWQDWQKHDAQFHSLLRHSEIDEIHVTVGEVLEALALADPSLYHPANARLITQLRLLSQMEQLTLQNVL